MGVACCQVCVLSGAVIKTCCVVVSFPVTSCFIDVLSLLLY